MESKVNYLIVGVFVVVFSVVLVGGVLWLSSGKSYRKSYDTYQVYMSESVSGLDINAPVKYRGVEIGRVRRIALAPGNVEKVLLTLDVERGTPIKEDTVAVLRIQGLTGIAFVELSGGSRAAPILQAQPEEEYPVIRAGPSLLVRLDAQLTSLLTNLNRTSENLNGVMDEENRRVFKRTLAEVETVTRTLAARSGTIDAGIVSASRVLQDASRVTAELPRLVERVQRSAEAFERMSNEVAGAGASATRTLEATRGDVRQFTAEALPEMQLLVVELRELTHSLQRVADQLDQNPSVLLFGKPAKKRGPGE